jgi:hypothetical protein
MANLQNITMNHSAHAGKVSSLTRLEEKNRKKVAKELLALSTLLTLLKGGLSKQNNNQASSELEPVIPPVLESFLLAMMKALENDNASLSHMEEVDAKTTLHNVSIQEDIYNFYNQMMQTAADDIYAWAGKVGDNKYKDAAAMVQYYQSVFSEDSSQAQGSESSQSGLIDSSKQQATSDAQNLSMKVQMAQQMMTVLSSLSGMLGRITG